MSIRRQTPAGSHFNHISGTQVALGDGFPHAVAQTDGGVGLQRHQRAHPLPCAAGGPAFETLADQEQQQDHRRFRSGADKQRPDGGDAHQRFNGKPAPALDQAQRLASNRPQANQGGGNKGQLTGGVVGLLQPPAQGHHDNQRQ